MTPEQQIIADKLAAKAKELSVSHQGWLTNPVTRELARILYEHENRIADSICTISKDTSEEGQRKLSQLAVQLNTTRTITKLIYDTNVFTQSSQRTSSGG